MTCGGRDTSCRVWKLVEESQLVFSGHRDSIDCIRLINEEHWVTGGQDGYVTQTQEGSFVSMCSWVGVLSFVGQSCLQIRAMCRCYW